MADYFNKMNLIYINRGDKGRWSGARKNIVSFPARVPRPPACLARAGTRASSLRQLHDEVGAVSQALALGPDSAAATMADWYDIF
jgi:hypothetical protein